MLMHADTNLSDAFSHWHMIVFHLPLTHDGADLNSKTHCSLAKIHFNSCCAPPPVLLSAVKCRLTCTIHTRQGLQLLNSIMHLIYFTNKICRKRNFLLNKRKNIVTTTALALINDLVFTCSHVYAELRASIRQNITVCRFLHRCAHVGTVLKVSN